MDELACRIEIAARSDLAEILVVQRQAFGRVAHEMGIDPAALPPLCETVDQMQSLLEDSTTFFVARSQDGSVVGSVRGTPAADRIEIGRLVVLDGWTRRGIASALVDAVEAHHPNATCLEVFTGADAIAPLSLYLHRGYREIRRSFDGPVELVWLRKYAVTHD